MITELSELRQAKQLYQECYQELKNADEQILDLKIGMMFEIPGALLLCEHFMPELDFCAIGSNDLTQYVLAVDRNNPMIAHLYDPLHPAILRLIQQLLRVADQYAIPVSLCGEMASDPEGCIILLGLGLRIFSMNAALIPMVKERFSSISLADAQKLAEEAIQCSSAQQVRYKIAEYLPPSSIKL